MDGYQHGDTIRFRDGDKTLTGWVEGPPIYDEQENIVGYMVAGPQFQGAVNAHNIIDDKE